MLVLKLRTDSDVVCGVGRVKVLETGSGFVRLGFMFPQDVLACLAERLEERKQQANKAARFARLKVASGTRDAA